MVGAAVLEECLRNPAVGAVLTVGRSSTGLQHEKLTELTHADLFHLEPLGDQLSGYNACFYTLGATSVGQTEESYTRLTFELTKQIAQAVLEANPGMAMVFVSGGGSDSSEQGPVMWARIKGKAENLLLGMPFSSVTVVRLAGLVPAKGFRSKTFLYRLFYVPLGPVLPLFARAFPRFITTPTILGRAFIRAAQGLAPKPILEAADIHALGAAPDATTLSDNRRATP